MNFSSDLMFLGFQGFKYATKWLNWDFQDTISLLCAKNESYVDADIHVEVHVHDYFDLVENIRGSEV